MLGSSCSCSWLLGAPLASCTPISFDTPVHTYGNPITLTMPKRTNSNVWTAQAAMQQMRDLENERVPQTVGTATAASRFASSPVRALPRPNDPLKPFITRVQSGKAGAVEAARAEVAKLPDAQQREAGIAWLERWLARQRKAQDTLPACREYHAFLLHILRTGLIHAAPFPGVPFKPPGPVPWDLVDRAYSRQHRYSG